MGRVTLDGIELNDGLIDDAMWLNRIRFSRLIQQERRALDQNVVIYQEPIKSGQAINIRCVLTFAKIRLLQSLRDSGAAIVLVYDTYVGNVVFAAESAIDYQPIDEEAWNNDDDITATCEINLVTI